MARVLARLNDGLPLLKYLGFAFWVAWFGVTYSQAIWLTPTEAGAAAVNEMFLVSTAAHVLALVACILGYRSVPTALSRPSLVAAAAAASALGCALVVAAGPLYAHSHLMFLAGSALTGLGTAALCMNGGLLLCAARPAEALRVVLVCELVACLVGSMASGLPRMLSTVLFVCLPLLSGACFLVGSPGRRAANEQELGRLTPTRDLWRLLATACVLCVTARFAQSFFAPGKTPGQLGTEGSVTSFVTLACVAALLLALSASRRRPGFSSVFYPAAGVILLALMACCLFPEGAGASVVVSAAAFQLFDIAMWCACITIVNQTKISATLLVACVRVAVSLGVTAGASLGNTLAAVSPDGQLSGPASLALLAVNLVMLLCVFPEQRAKRLLAPIPDEDEPGADSEREVDAGAPTAETTLGDEPGSGASKGTGTSVPASSAMATPERQAVSQRGRWKTLCLQLADEAGLTEREKEVFVLLAKGRGSQSISDALTISLYTTRAHTRNIYAKLDVHSRHELSEYVERYVEEHTA